MKLTYATPVTSPDLGKETCRYISHVGYAALDYGYTVDVDPFPGGVQLYASKGGAWFRLEVKRRPSGGYSWGCTTSTGKLLKPFSRARAWLFNNANIEEK